MDTDQWTVWFATQQPRVVGDLVVRSTIRGLPCNFAIPIFSANNATSPVPGSTLTAAPPPIITNPATGEVLGHVPELGAAETRRAIEAAHAALPGWRALTAQARATILRRWFNLLLEHQEDLATLMTLEQGKPLAEARGEIAYAASFLEWFAEEGKRVYGDVIPDPVARPADSGAEGAGRRVRGDHAVELSQRR